MENLDFTKSLLRNQNIKKIFKKIKNQPEMRERCARCRGNNGTRDYEVPGALDDAAAHSCSMRRTAQGVIKYSYF